MLKLENPLDRGREPPDAMSLRYADTITLQDLLGRLSLHYADRASAMQ